MAKKKKGVEEEQHIDAGDWVLLGKHKDVDDKYEGHLAVVMDTNGIDRTCMDPDCPSTTGYPHRHQDPKGLLTVKTRDQYSATLSVPLSAIKKRDRQGRSELLGLAQ